MNYKILINRSPLKLIVDELSKLTLLDIDSDIKGDAFEYFLKDSITVGNDLGEYYTPRHIVKLMVSLVNPKFGDKIYDPCCGTGGFLIEAFRHIRKNCNITKKNLQILEKETIWGGELTETAKIAKMNMILAGDGHTHIKQQDSLAFPIKEEEGKGEKRFDIILTNFPFSQTTEHANLYKMSAKSANPVFLKHVIDALKPNGKAAVIVPDSILFSNDNDNIKVRKELVEKCEVEAVIQLGNFTFAPYTKQPTSIIIFNKIRKTNNIWFFDLINDGFSETGKRYPSAKNDIPDLRILWHDKVDSDKSFTLENKKINKDNYKLFLNFYKTFTPVKNPIKLSTLCSDFVLGGTPLKSENSFYNGRHLWATISDMNQKYITDTKLKLSDAGVEKLGKIRIVEKGSLLMSFKLTLGKTAFAGAELFTNEAIVKLVLKDEYNTDEIKEYLYHILPLVNYTPFAQRAAKGYTLNKDLLPTVEIPFPDSKEERYEIVKKKTQLEKERNELKNELLKNELLKNEEKYQSFITSDILGY
ncbi:putative type I restriction enzymeP M protein [termite gut metagenome]|uniref:site-specific DNA-methyltransferase (adenine-specific) n=1 Tax=termite gut metagenome TaxID=433724 RepID=A0A5J4R7H4_9ZZZZ